MNRRSTLILSLFAVISLIHLCGHIFEIRPLAVLTKPFLVTLLALFFFLETEPFRQGRFPLLILLGLLFSVGGDVLLIFPGTTYFLLGLSSFLLAHICYLGAFILVSSSSGRSFLVRQPLAGLPLILFLVFFGWWLWGGLSGELRIPVITYAAVITSMALSCLNLAGALPAPLFLRLFSGVLLFMVSDSLLATDRFMAAQVSVPLAGVLIMATYLGAQYLIATSCAAITRAQPVAGDAV